MKYIKIIAALFLCLSFTACGDDDTIIDEVTGRVFEGTVANGLEDCGWLIEINGQNYVPNVLNSQFREENLEVFLKVEFLNEPANCSQLALAPERLRIEQIRVVQ
ncbi:MAG: hypothetical protein HEP71_23615 [Roseivirga sp.]|nr:hypothetical protein [Roseivirga sp.]